MEKRIIIVSNRLPFRIEKRQHKYEIREASGGLVSALKSLIENYKDQSEIVWVGCADFSVSEWEQNRALFDGLGFKVRPVFLRDKKLERLYYHGFSNSTIWPLFHYFPSYAEFSEEQYGAYKKVNQLFADEILKIATPNDTIWIHDYHLMLLSGMLKAENKYSEIGFFLHIPFPSYEIFRLLPEVWREEILKNLIQADLIGFQTREYVNHFLSTASFIAGIENDHGKIYDQGHLCIVSDYPISIDYGQFHNAYHHPAVEKNRKALLEKNQNVKIIFSVDRLDYTKGVLNRLYALEQLLEQNPEYKEKVIFILNVVPSRDDISRYSDRKKMIEENIGRINGKYGNIHWQPVLYQYRHLNFNQLLGFYTACDVALVTPLRDGMNLVAKEFVASRADRKGVLILSEMAGAAHELDLAVIVNPTDTFKLKESLISALNMPEEEQSKRMDIMQQTVAGNDVNNWVQKFMHDLNNVKETNKKLQVNILSYDQKNSILESYKTSSRRLILLDYDGTLTGFTLSPEEAKPSEHVLRLIKNLSGDEKNHLCIISGRKPKDLEQWFGDYHVTLIAEHGCMYKLPKNSEWLQMGNLDIGWKENIKAILKKQVLLYPGSFIEEKTYSLVWHYRNVHEKMDDKLFIELNKKLSAINFGNLFKVLHGNKVLEVKCSNINKGIASLKLLSSHSFDFVMAIGDDATDEEMFDALNAESHITIKVGLEKTKAKYNLININTVLSFLDQINATN